MKLYIATITQYVDNEVFIIEQELAADQEAATLAAIDKFNAVFRGRFTNEDTTWEDVDTDNFPLDTDFDLFELHTTERELEI